MSRADAAAVEAAIAGARASGTGWYRVNCPLCLSRVGTPDRHAALGVNAETGGYRCFRCHARGRIGNAPAGGSGLPALGVDEEREEPMRLPASFVPLGHGPGATAETLARARAYLTGRGVTRATVRDVGIGYCDLRGPRICVPVRDAAGDLRGWLARTLGRAEPRYFNAPGGWAGEVVFGDAALDADTDAPVLVVEGVFDALPYWPHAVAVMGKPTEQQTARIAEARRPVVVALDGDAHDEGWALAAQLTLMGVRAAAVRLPAASDPATVPRDWLLTQADAAVRAL